MDNSANIDIDRDELMCAVANTASACAFLRMPNSCLSATYYTRYGQLLICTRKCCVCVIELKRFNKFESETEQKKTALISG